MAELTKEELIENQITEYEKKCTFFGYGKKGRVAGIMRALLTENAELKKKIEDLDKDGITGEGIVSLLQALPVEKQLSGKFLKDNTTPVSPYHFEYVGTKEDPK